jgi:hypothetical protein
MIRTGSRLFFALVLGTALAIAQRGQPIPQQLTFTAHHASGIYDIGETVGWTVTPGPVTPTYAYKWTHNCPAITRTESIVWRNRVNRFGSRVAEVPVKWAFSQKASRSKSVEFGKG